MSMMTNKQIRDLYEKKTGYRPSSRTVTRYMKQMRGCVKIGHSKNAWLRVPQESVEEFIEGGYEEENNEN